MIIEKLRTQSKLHLQELLIIKQIITNFIYGSWIFRRRERAGDIDIERPSSIENFGWDKDGRQSIDILGQKWLCTTKKALQIEILHFCGPCGFPCKDQNIQLEKLAERSYLSILTLIEKIQPLVVEEIGFFPASAISATEDFGSRHKNENIERRVYESTSIVWHPDVRYLNVCFDEKESQCQENSFDSRTHSFSSPIRFRRPQPEHGMPVLKDFSR